MRFTLFLYTNEFTLFYWVFLLFIYIRFFVFCITLTCLEQIKKKKKHLNRTQHSIKLDNNWNLI